MKQITLVKRERRYKGKLDTYRVKPSGKSVYRDRRRRWWIQKYAPSIRDGKELWWTRVEHPKTSELLEAAYNDLIGRKVWTPKIKIKTGGKK